MPKIFNTSLLGILLATIGFYMIGFVWFSALFGEMWMTATGITEEIAQARMDALGPMFFIWGLLISLFQVLGLAYVLNHANASRLITSIKVSAVTALLIAIPISAYAVLYENGSVLSFKIGLGHTLVGYIFIGAVLSFFRRKT